MRGGKGRMTKIQCFVHPPFRSGGCAVGVPEPPPLFGYIPPAPGRGVLRSQVPSPLMHRHTKRGKNLSASSLFWSGKRDAHSRCARAISRILADTPGPWKGRFEVACAESPHAPAYEKREEPFGFFPLLERKTDFRPKYIPRLQSAYYDKHFLEGHSRDAVIMHSFAPQCFRQRYELFSHNSRTLFKLFSVR